MEFRKRINPDLPFYYYTCAHDRYYEDVMPDFQYEASKAQEAGPFTHQGIDWKERVSFSHPNCERARQS